MMTASCFCTIPSSFWDNSNWGVTFWPLGASAPPELMLDDVFLLPLSQHIIQIPLDSRFVVFANGLLL